MIENSKITIMIKDLDEHINNIINNFMNKCIELKIEIQKNINVEYNRILLDYIEIEFIIYQIENNVDILVGSNSIFNKIINEKVEELTNI